MFHRLKAQPVTKQIDPLPGWFDRRRKALPPAADALKSIPSGAVVALPA
jgi:hypothetical protein